MADRSAILDRITDLIDPFNKAGVAVGEATRFADDLQFDSLTVMDLVAGIEDEWDIILPLNRLPEIETVGQLADAVTEIADRKA